MRDRATSHDRSLRRGVLSRDRPTGGGRHGLLSRVLERRRLDVDADESQPQPQGAPATDARIAELAERVNRLEALVEGLQDSVHRDSLRRGHQIQELEDRTDPAEMSRSIAGHSRKHGL
jgi:hypothetical protein